MVTPALIEPRGIYDDGALVLALGIPSATLIRARRAGHLRYSRKGKRVFYVGQWVLDWITFEQRNGPAPEPGKL